MSENLWCTSDVRTVEKMQKTSIKEGLTNKQAQTRIEEYGLNIIQTAKKISPIKMFFLQFKDFMVLVLLGATVASAYLGEVADAITIVIIVLINAVLGFIQEYKSEKSLEALTKLSSPKSLVKRDGKHREIISSQLVPGDVIILNSGDKVAADARLVESSGLQIDESILTGEFKPVSKRHDCVLKSDVIVSERVNMVHAGSIVTRGHGVAIVTGTGMDTEMGSIAALIKNSDEEQTPLQKRLDQLGKILVEGCLGICIAVAVLGICQGNPFDTMIMTAISLAVAAIPEGLPAIVTVCLAIGVQQMSKKNAIVRKLRSVETLGCADIICTDKTGTLTKNEMTVKVIEMIDESIDVTGTGYSPFGELKVKGLKIKANVNERLKKILLCSALCNDSILKYENKTWSILGDPTEGALLVLINKADQNFISQISTFTRKDEIPFDSDLKYMAVVCKNRQDEKNITFVKGAVSEVLKMCKYRYKGLKKVLIDDKYIQSVMRKNDEMASCAMRVLAMASADENALIIKNDENKKKVKQELTFLGLVGMTDPPRPEVSSAVLKAKQAGIRTIMITGDNAITGQTIAKELNIIRRGGKVITGEEIERLSDVELRGVVENTDVFARVAPIHKLRIVKALKSNDHVVAMTGDGVNDAPAIREADIGIAMGKSGTDVAREASCITLVDDDYSTIVAAIEEGRGIYENIRKFIRYLLACNVGEVLTMLISVGTGLPIPMTPIQILWMNLVTDGLPAMALSVDPMDDDVMDYEPRNTKEGIFARKLGSKIISQGVSIAFITISTFCISNFLLGNGIMVSRTMTFTVLVITQLFYVFKCRSEKKSVLSKGLFSNKYLFGAVLISLILHICIICIPAAQHIFDTTSLNLLQWFICVGFAFVSNIISSFLDTLRG